MSILNKGIISKALASAGSFLLVLSGQSQAMPNHAQDVSNKRSLEEDSLTKESQPGAQTPSGRVTIDEVERDGQLQMAAHVNSGPTTHTNVPGHADFTGQVKPGVTQVKPGTVQKQTVVRPSGGAAASHVNSGPTTHSNVPGHADFTGQVKPGVTQVKPTINR